MMISSEFFGEAAQVRASTDLFEAPIVTQVKPRWWQ